VDMEDGSGTVIDLRPPGGRERQKGRGDEPMKHRSQAVEHLPEGATRAEGYRAGKVTRAKRRTDVLALAVAGYSADQIAEQLSEKYVGQGMSRITKRAVQNTINKALTEWREQDSAKIENVRAMQLARLEEVLSGIYLKARKGDLGAVDRVVRLEALRAKIAGTEAPRRIDFKGEMDHRISPQEVEREEKAWLSAGGDAIDLPDDQVEEEPDEAGSD
jgi:hypothetical protein